MFVRYTNLFWGVLFLQVGVTLLLARWDISIVPSHFVWKAWPLVLVCWGVAAMAKTHLLKVWAVALSALCLGFLITSAVNLFWSGDGLFGRAESVQRQELVKSYDQSIQRASLDVEMTAGSIKILEDVEDLVSASCLSNIGTYMLQTERTGESVHLKLTLDRNHAYLLGRSITNDVEVRLNSRPEWDLSLDVGAARLEADLSSYKTKSVRIDAGAASVDVKLGAHVAESSVDIDAGAASVRLEVPEHAGCEIRVDAGLTSKRFSGFERIDSGVYRTENFESAERRILIRLDAGASRIRIERYHIPEAGDRNTAVLRESV